MEAATGRGAEEVYASLSTCSQHHNSYGLISLAGYTQLPRHQVRLRLVGLERRKVNTEPLGYQSAQTYLLTHPHHPAVAPCAPPAAAAPVPAAGLQSAAAAWLPTCGLQPGQTEPSMQQAALQCRRCTCGSNDNGSGCDEC
jgi:hypothetical protein